MLVITMMLSSLVGSWDVMAATVKAPTVNPVFYDATTISGANLAKAKVNKETVIATVHVTLKGEDGKVKATLTDNPTSGTTWKVDLPGGVKVEKGDTVTVYQQIGEDKSPEVTKTAQQSKASSVTLTMPSGEIWIEQPSSNQVNEDEQAEAVEMLKAANPDIASDIKDVKFSIDSTEHAYYEVTYTDESTSGKIEATGLVIKQVTETSAAPTIEKVQVTDGQIIVTLENEVAAGTKFYFVSNFTDGEENGFCKNGSCVIDKSTSKEMSQAVSIEGKKVTFPINDKVNDLKLGKEFGIVVKEPHKFRSCAKKEPVVTTPAKVDVRDPHKLTDADKKAIDKAIRDANTVNGKSKLPNSLEGMDYPAFIDFDKDGNARIINPDYVKGEWDWVNYPDGKFIPEQNADGTYKVKEEYKDKVISIPAKDLLKNIKPDAPAVALSGDKKSITITPNEKDTDANSISVSYTGKDGSTKTTTATKDKNGTWSISEGEGSVDQNGVITLPKDKVKGGTDVTATVTDKGGVADDDTTPLTSDPGTLKIISKAEQIKELGGLDPVDIKKWVGDKIEEGFWKEGVKAKDDAKKDEVEELLKGAKFEEVTEEKRTTTKEGDFEGKIKITFDDKSELVVEKQMLYVSNHVTSMKRKDKVPTDALDVEFKLGEGTKVDNTGSGAIEGNKDNPTSYSKYKVKPGTDLKEYNLPALNTSVVDSIKVTLQEGYTDAVWNNKDGAVTDNFVVSDNNNVFVATATKTAKVSYNANGGSGNMEGKTLKAGSKYTLLDNAFKAPNENQEFKAWEVNGKEVAAGTEITVNKDTEIKAIWKDIEYKVSFDGNTGTGSMDTATVKKGKKYKLPENTFGTPQDKQGFKTWEIDGKEVAPGTEITVEKDTVVKAIWKDIEVKINYNANGGSGKMAGATVKKGGKYTLLENTFGAPSDKQEFKAWEVDGKEVEAGTEITVDKDTEVKAIWKDIEYKVSFDGNTGTGSIDAATVKKGEKYKLPENTFGTPQDKKGFRAWEVDGKEVAPGTEITIEKDTVVKAIWEGLEYKVTFNGNTGTGSINAVTVKKGEKYKLPDNTFGAPSDKQEFKTWEVDGKEVAPGTEITIDKDTVVKAIWKDKSTTPGDEPGTEPGQDPNKPGEEPGVKPSPDTQVYNPWWPIWFGSSEVKPATPVAPVKPAVEMERGIHRKYLYGYKDHTVRPEGLITRAEAAALIARLAELNMSDNSKPNFKDTPSAWYNTAINAVLEKNLMFADKDGDFRPNEPITRGEFARALFFIDKKNNAVAPFADVKGHVYEEAINQAYGNDRIKGYPDGTFKPDATITRAEAATILNNYADRNVTFKGMVEVHKDVVKFTDINESHWAYYEIMEAANTHEYQREKGTIPETWLEILKK